MVITLWPGKMKIIIISLLTAGSRSRPRLLYLYPWVDFVYSESFIFIRQTNSKQHSTVISQCSRYKVATVPGGQKANREGDN